MLTRGASSPANSQRHVKGRFSTPRNTLSSRANGNGRAAARCLSSHFPASRTVGADGLARCTLRVRLHALNSSAPVLVSLVSGGFSLETSSDVLCLFGNQPVCQVQLGLVASVVPFGQEMAALFDTLLTADAAGAAFFARVFLTVPRAACPSAPMPLARLFDDTDVQDVALWRNGTSLSAVLVNKGLVWGSFSAHLSCPLEPQYVQSDVSLACALPPGGSCPLSWTVSDVQVRPIVQCNFVISVLPAACAVSPQSFSRVMVFAVVLAPLPEAFVIILYVLGGLMAFLFLCLVAAWSLVACLKCLMERDKRVEERNLGAFFNQHMQPVSPDVNPFETQNE